MQSVPAADWCGMELRSIILFFLPAHIPVQLCSSICILHALRQAGLSFLLPHNVGAAQY